MDNDRADGHVPPGRWDHLPACRSRCRRYRLSVRPDRIGFVHAVVEGYDGVARVRTEDSRTGAVEVLVVDDWDSVVRRVLEDLVPRTGLRVLETNEGS